MKALIDTNVILDVMTMRQTFYADSVRVMDRAERGDFTAWVCATTVTTIFYLARRHLGAEETHGRISDLVSVCQVAAVNQSVIDSALASSFDDFEDAVLNEAAITAGADCIVTRNGGDFRKSGLLIYSPAQFLKALG